MVEFVAWCHFYYNIFNADPPIPDNIIEDDDKLDNYLYKLKLARHQQEVKNAAKNRTKSSGKGRRETDSFSVYDPNDIY